MTSQALNRPVDVIEAYEDFCGVKRGHFAEVSMEEMDRGAAWADFKAFRHAYELNELFGNSEQLREMKTALHWYGEMALLMQRATLRGDSQSALRVMREMALDGGKRSRLGSAK